MMKFKSYCKDMKKCTGLRGMVYILLRILQAVFPTCMIFVFSNLVDYLLSEQNIMLENVFWRLMLVIIVVGLSKLADVLSDAMKKSMDLECTIFFKEKILVKVSKLPYESLENIQIIELVKRTKDNAGERTSGFVSNILSILGYVIKIESVVILVGSHMWWVGALILSILFISIVVSFESGQEEYDAFEQAEVYRRKADAMSSILHSKEFVLERKLYNYVDFVEKRFVEAYEKGRKKEFEAEIKSFGKAGFMSFLMILFSFACVLLLIIPVMQQTMSVGIYISLVTNILSLIEQMSWELSMLIIDFTKNKLYIKDLYELFELQEEVNLNEGKDIDAIESLEFRDVSFAYSAGGDVVLQNLSFKIEAGKSYAIVGENGCGKSTIIKILMGLYNGYKGQILLNGKEIHEYPRELRNKLFHFIFQDFNQYKVSIREFLSIGNREDITEGEIFCALRKTGMFETVKNLPKHLDTLLGKIYEDGIDLSGGQWQKLVTTRTLLSNAQMLVLDEPTSALDPIHERAVYEEYRRLSVNNHSITLMVSHRLGCIQWADEILVLENGRVLEQGTHKQLIEKEGRYSQMFKVQKEWYYEK